MLADIFQELLSKPNTQLIAYVLFIGLIAFMAGTGLWFLGGFYGESWNDVPMDEAMWQAWYSRALHLFCFCIFSLSLLYLFIYLRPSSFFFSWCIGNSLFPPVHKLNPVDTKCA